MLRTAFVFCLLAFGWVAEANAGLMLLDATSTIQGVGDFSVTFNDSGDGLLQLDEVTQFSGLSFPGFGSAPLEDLLGVPGIAGFATGGSLWAFALAGAGIPVPPFGVSVSPDVWTYSKSVVSEPEPGTLSLIAAGVVALGILRRKSRIK